MKKNLRKKKKTRAGFFFFCIYKNG